MGRLPAAMTRRAADLHAAHDARHVAAAQARVRDLDVHEVCALGALLALDGGELDVRVLVEDGAHLGGHAHVGQAVGAVGRDLAVEHGVRRAAIVRERHAHGGVLGQDHDAGVVSAQAKLALGAVHAARLDATQLALLDLEVAGKHGADHRDDDLVALVEVLGAAHNLQRGRIAVLVNVLVAHGDLAQPHVVGVGVGLLGEHLAHDDVLEVGANALDRLDLGAGADELGVEDLRVIGQVHHGAEPLI